MYCRSWVETSLCFCLHSDTREGPMAMGKLLWLVSLANGVCILVQMARKVDGNTILHVVYILWILGNIYDQQRRE